MAAADVSLKLDTKDRLLFAHSPMRALVFALVSLGFTAICWFAIRDSDPIRYGFTAFSLLFVAAGVAGTFWRMELDVDLLRRRVRQVRGMWPNPLTTSRSLDEADGVWLTMEYRSSGSQGNRRKVPWWFVSLRFPDEKKGTALFATRREVEGYQQWEDYARRLELPAVDATDQEAERRDWASLDESMAERSNNGATTAPVPVQPVGSAAEFRTANGRRELVLPPLGFSGGLVVLVLFGGAFTAMGAGPLLASLGFIDMRVQGSEAALLLIPPIFLLMGGGIIWLGIKGSFSSTVLGVTAGALYMEQVTFGRRSGREEIRLDEVESIEVSGDVRSRRRRASFVRIGGVSVGRKAHRERDCEIVLRSDRKILRFGSFLSDPEQEWLADVCRFAAHYGRLP